LKIANHGFTVIREKIEATAYGIFGIPNSNEEWRSIRPNTSSSISKLDASINGFGFDPVFMPERAVKTLAEDKPDQSLEL
jgi:inosine/xanthosine triphosphate pyrophosphatase family protein